MTDEQPTNVFVNGQGDVRQTDAPRSFGLFRNRYRKLNPDEVVLHDRIKGKADELADLFGAVLARDFPTSEVHAEADRNFRMALEHLEDAVYRAVKALTA